MALRQRRRKIETRILNPTVNTMTGESPFRKLSQETIAVFSVGATLLAAFIALAGLILVSTGRVADEARDARQTLRAEARAGLEETRAGLEEARAEREEVRAEARAGREELRAEIRATREDLRAEIRATREDLRAEMQTLRRELQAEMRAFQEAVREETRAFRAEAQADRIAFAREITRLAERQGHLDGLVEGLRSAQPVPAAPTAADS